MSSSKDIGISGLIGESDAIKKVLQKVEKIAPTKLCTYIYGPSGTGKELVARGIHNKSARKDKQFIVVNCASISDTTSASEIFGHEKGAFTDAHKTHKGLFEIADGGTFFLDEVADLPASIQAKLLRIIQFGELVRVGGDGSKTIKVNVRIIVATNKNLAKEVKAKRFRLDLYQRINKVKISLPPLKDRDNDVILIADRLLTNPQKLLEHERNIYVGKKQLSDEAKQFMHEYEWPGNIRQLENLLTNAVLFSDNDLIKLEQVKEIAYEDHALLEESLNAKTPLERIADVVEGKGIVTRVASGSEYNSAIDLFSDVSHSKTENSVVAERNSETDNVITFKAAHQQREKKQNECDLRGDLTAQSQPSRQLNASDKTESRYQKITRTLDSHGALSTQEIQKTTDIPRTTLKASINKLVKDGILRGIGSGQQTQHELATNSRTETRNENSGKRPVSMINLAQLL